MLVYPLRRRWHAVVQLHIYPGGTWYHKVKHEDVPEIVDSFRLQRPQEFLPRRRNQRLRG